MSTPTLCPPPRFDPARRKRVTFALLLVSGLASFESTVVTTAMPTIIGDLSGLPLYAWAFSVYLLSSTISMPVYGRLADLFGRRRMMLTSIILFSVGATACSLAKTMPMLIAARGLEGLGAGGLVPLAMTVAGDLFSMEERAKIQGVFSSVWGISALAGPPLGAALTVSLGWRSIFWVALPLALVAGIIVATQLAEARPAAGDPVDVPGIVLLALCVTGLLFSLLERAGGDGIPAGVRAALAVTGVFSLALFVYVEHRSPHPLIPLDLFAGRGSAAPFFSGILLGVCVFGVDTFVPLFVQGARGGTVGAAGAVVTPLIFFWALSGTLGAKAVIRFGFRRTAEFGAATVTLGLAGLLIAAHSEAPVFVISITCAVVGAGLGPMSMSQVLAVQHAADASRRGIASSLVPFFRVLGGSLGVGLLGALFAHGLGRRLGKHAARAGEVLAGHRQIGTVALDPARLRDAVGGALVPVFVLLVCFALANTLLAARFPASHLDAKEPPAPLGVE